MGVLLHVYREPISSSDAWSGTNIQGACRDIGSRGELLFALSIYMADTLLPEGTFASPHNHARKVRKLRLLSTALPRAMRA